MILKLSVSLYTREQLMDAKVDNCLNIANF